MDSSWDTKQPEMVVDKILRRAEVSRMARTLQNRLALAQFKTNRGWEDLTLDIIEPRVEEERRQRRPTSSGDILSDSSSSTASDFRYANSRQLMSSPLKAPAVFCDEISSGGSRSSSDRRKRTHYNGFDKPSSSTARKRFRSSPTAGRSLNESWKANHQLTQSSPIKPRKAHFTTTSGPNLSFFGGSSTMADDMSMNFATASDDEENILPAHSFQVRSSPPRTPPPVRSRNGVDRRNKEKNGKSGEEGADLLLYLATSPSPANPSRSRMQPPSTPPAKNNLALPSSVMVTPGGGGGILSGFGAPNTPSQGFDFSDFVHTTPSPFQPPRGRLRTPATIKRRGLTFEDFIPPGASPTMRTPTEKRAAGLGMQLGGSLDR